MRIKDIFKPKSQKVDIFEEHYKKYKEDIIKPPKTKPKTEYDNGSGLTEDGRFYDFTYLTEDEYSTIIDEIKSCKEQATDDTLAIILCRETESLLYKPKSIMNNIITLKFQNSNNPLDILAVAMTYARGYANERPFAIHFFEKWLDNPVELADLKIFEFYKIHLELIRLYESEHMFEKAISYIDTIIDETNEDIDKLAVLVENKAMILSKIDINQAVEYLKSEIPDPKFVEHQHIRRMQIILEDLKKKKDRNYKFRPRKAKTEDNNNIAQEQKEYLASIFFEIL